MYFKIFPQTKYDFNAIGTKDLDILDILFRVRFLFDDIFTSRSYTTYTVKHGDTADIIAHKYYGSSEWWWLVLLYNDIVNPFNELPRMGFDYRSIPGAHPSPNPIIYIQKEGGDTQSDFRQGDVVVKIRNEDAGKIDVGNAWRTWNQPQALQPSNSDFAAAKIMRWNDTLREATLTDVSGNSFYTGDTVGVLSKNDKEPTRLAYWGTVLLSLPDNSEAISHFIENDSGREVHPHYSIQERIVKPSGPLYNKFDTANTTNNISGTLLNDVLGGSGSSGSTYSNQFSAVTNEEIYEKKTFDDKARSRIKLLDDTYKFEAYNLMRKLLSDRNLTYATFSTRSSRVRKSPFSGPSTPSSNTNIAKSSNT